MNSPEHHLVNTPTLRWIGVVLLSGISLLGVLPLGMMSVLQPCIPFFSIIHAGTLLIAATIGVVYLYQLAAACRWSPLLTWSALAVPLAALVILGRLPITDPAALSTYLALPKWWLDSGAIVPFLWFPPSLEPGLIGLAFAEFLNNDLIRFVPLYGSLFLICIATLTARFAEHRTHRKESACLAFLLTLTVPIALRSATVPWPNLPTALFVGIAIVVLVGWLEDDRRRTLTILAGIAFGLGAACSSDGIVALLAALPALYWGARAGNIGWWGSWRSCITVALSAFVFFSPWLIKNALWLANPFYPLGGDLLGTNALIAGGGTSLDLSTSLIILAERWREFLGTPFAIAFFSHDGAGGGYDGVASPLFVLALIPLWTYRKHPAVLFLTIFLMLFFLCAAIRGVVNLRDFLPLLLPVTSLTILGIGSIGRRFKRRFERAAVGFLVAAQIVSCAMYVAERAYRLDALSFRIDETSYLREHLPDYQMIERINRTVPRTEYVYDLLATPSFFYLTPRLMTGGINQIAQIEQWLRTSTSPRILAQEFLNRGIRFLTLDGPKLSAALDQRVTAREATLWAEFVRNNLIELEAIESRRLYRIELDRSDSAKR